MTPSRLRHLSLPPDGGGEFLGYHAPMRKPKGKLVALLAGAVVVVAVGTIAATESVTAVQEQLRQGAQDSAPRHA